MLVAPLAQPIKFAVMGLTAIAGLNTRLSRRGRRARTPGARTCPNTDEGHGLPILGPTPARICGVSTSMGIARPTARRRPLLSGTLSTAAFGRAAACQARIAPTAETRHRRRAPSSTSVEGAACPLVAPAPIPTRRTVAGIRRTNITTPCRCGRPYGGLSEASVACLLAPPCASRSTGNATEWARAPLRRSPPPRRGASCPSSVGALMTRPWL